MVMALKPLHDIARIKRVVVATYQSVSGAGRAAMEELHDQLEDYHHGHEFKPSALTKPIACNVIPHIDVFMDGGDTKEEWKMAVETQKILDPSIVVTATCVRVPVFIGHAEAVNVEFEAPVSEQEARAALSAFRGVQLFDDRSNGGYMTPIELEDRDQVYVSRLRRDPTVPHGLNLWVVANNLRKGAALNAVQIAELLVKNWAA